MTIQEIIRECVVALFADDILKRTLVLKGGTALHLVEKIDTRLSTDIDFSVIEKIENPNEYFEQIFKALSIHFSKLGFEVFDATHKKKPNEKSEKKPIFWSGWCFEFKLVSKSITYKNIEDKQRKALQPDGVASTKIQLEISEYEYCKSIEKVKIGGSYIVSYSSPLLIAEKLRALCQQHPDYPYGKLKNRTRDYFDIDQLLKKHRSAELYTEVKTLIPDVFSAKDVPLVLLKKIFDPSFIAFQESHFQTVESTVRDPIEHFHYYLEQVRLLVSDLGYL